MEAGTEVIGPRVVPKVVMVLLLLWLTTLIVPEGQPDQQEGQQSWN